MRAKQLAMAVVSTALLAAMPAVAQTTVAVVATKADLKWKDVGNGVAVAPVWGDMANGPSRFFLKYPVGLVTPKHYHSAKHFALVTSGTAMLTIDGKDYKLGPGSYVEQPAKTWHVAKVEGSEEVVWFIHAEGPWDAVFDK